MTLQLAGAGILAVAVVAFVVAAFVTGSVIGVFYDDYSRRD